MGDKQHQQPERFPKEALIGAGVLLTFTIVLVAAYRIAGIEPAAQIPEPEEIIASRDLRFEDGPDGSVLVYEVNDGMPDRIVHEYASGEGGFIRGVLRSLARTRQDRGIGREHPFAIIEQANGSLLLEDPETEQRIALHAFGPDNIESFRALLYSDVNPQ